MIEEPIRDTNPHDRRRFFRAGLFRVLRPLVEFAEERFAAALPLPRPFLRPPGALPEKEFLDTCLRCGACVDACPADAIAPLKRLDEVLKGTPYVDPAAQACVICDELACMKVCPSGALRLVGRLEIRMGLALVDEGRCVRSRGEPCTICVDRCPLGTTAIRVGGQGRIEVIEPAASGQGCTGCGVCQQACPTRPLRAIRVEPY